MKLATIALLGILLLGSFASMQATDPAGAGQVALAYNERWGPRPNDICIWYPLFVGDLNLNSLLTRGGAHKNGPSARNMLTSSGFRITAA